MSTQERNTDWFILKGDDKIGPFSYAAMIQMIQKNELYDYNYVWAPHMDSWVSVGETEDFSKDRLARVFENNSDLQGAFERRRSPRAAVEIPVYAHDNQKFFDGKSLSVSTNGALLLLNTPLLLPEQQILIHFKADVAFNARALVVRKHMTRSRINVKSGLHYAVRFTEVSGPGQDVLNQIVQNFTKEAC